MGRYGWAATQFESDVISDGTQTQSLYGAWQLWFESDVISDGTQTGLWQR